MTVGLPDAAPMREWQVHEPRLAYPAAAIEADFGAVPEEIELSVRQLSQAVGPGLPAVSRFMLWHLF